ncbi:MAG: hypothetical protein WDO13_05725 [Verrucomicrobiota bacterium]
MSTLLYPPDEKPAANSSASSTVPPPAVLQASHRWLRWRGALVAGVIGLAATLLAVAVIPGAWRAAQPLGFAGLWLGGIVLTAVAAAVAYRFAPGTLVETARHLDRRYSAKNRLEAVAVLQDSTSPLAQAQRDETAHHLLREAHPRPVRLFPWLVGALLLLAAAHVISVLLWLVPLLIPHAKPAPPPPAKETPKATITWVSPEAESKANPVEEVPTVAVAKSTGGLRNLTLEVSDNGVVKQSTPIPAEPYDKPGTHTIKVSIYLDEIDAQPYDIVSYYLRGERIASEKLPDVTSSIQFIQVRPFRDDVGQGSGHTSKGYDLLIRLKLAQLRAVKENFVLAHTDLPPNHPVRLAENKRVGENQAELAKKTGEVVQEFINEGLPTGMIDLLQQAEPQMEDAGKKILATQNAAALPPQQKALDLIVQVEKFFVKFMGPSSPGPTSYNPDDPFKEKQKHEMTQRRKAPAGQLEALAQFQAHLAQDLQHGPSPDGANAPGVPAPAGSASPNNGNSSPGAPSGSPSNNPSNTPSNAGASAGDGTVPLPPTQAVDPFGPDAEKGSFAERQTRIVQGISVLLNGNNVFAPPVKDALAAAQRDATDSMRQLNAGQDAAAREPAAAAARDLNQALAAMSQSGEEEAKQALSDAQQKLNDLAAQLRSLAGNRPPDAPQQLVDMAKQVTALRQRLNDEADHQQQAGSAKSADQLARLAEKIRAQEFASKLAEMSKGGLDSGRATALANQLEDAASQAVHGLTPQPTGQDYANLVNALERTRANLERVALKAQGQAPPAGHELGPGGQHPATAQGQAPGQGQQAQAPGQGQQGQQGQGQQQAQAQGKGQGQQGQGQGQQQAQAQGQGQGQQGQGQQQAQGQQGQGQGQGQQGQSTAQNQSQGQGQGQGQSTAQSQTPGQGQGQGHGDSHSNAQNQNNSAVPGGQGGGRSDPVAMTQNQTGGSGGNDPNARGSATGGGAALTPGGDGQINGNNEQAVPPTGQPLTGARLEAYHEAMENLKTQMQQSNEILKVYDSGQIEKIILHFDKDTSYRPVTDVDVIHFFSDLQKPLDALILQLQSLQEHAQRTETVQAPNLDDTPASYRAAVSAYFEAVSRDYRPPAPPPPAPAPPDGGDDAKP